MISLFKASNAAIKTINDHPKLYGDAVLSPISCKHTMAINGECSLELMMSKAVDDWWQEMDTGDVIAVPVPWSSHRQLFRIYEYDKDQTLTATFYARHIYFDLAGYTLIDTRPTDKTGAQALAIILDGTPFTGASDITTASTAYYIRKDIATALGSDDDNSFLSRWGGERFCDNFALTINKKLGIDRGYSIAYGKNITAIKVNKSNDALITRIIPVGYDGITLDGETPWVDSATIDDYPRRFDSVVTFEDVKWDPEDSKAFATLAEAQAELTKRAQAMFTAGVDKPCYSYEVSMVDLSRMDDYRDFAVLESIQLGDTIHVVHGPLKIKIETRLVSFDYDCLSESYTTLTLENVAKSYYDKQASTSASVDNILTSGGQVAGESIFGVIDSINARIKAQRNVEQPVAYRAMLFEDRVVGSDNYGALSIGTGGLYISNKRNVQDTDWVWSTAITAGSVIADAILTGKLVGLAFDLNLDTGQILMGLRDDKGIISSPVFKVVINTAEDGTKTANLYINGNGTFSGDLTAKTIATASGKFSVDSNGIMKAVDANFSGDITANSIATASGKFSVGTDGVVHATDAQLTSVSSTDGAYHRGTYNAGTYNSSTDNNGAYNNGTANGGTSNNGTSNSGSYNNGSYNYGSLNGTNGSYTGDVSNSAGRQIDISSGQVSMNYNGTTVGTLSATSSGNVSLYSNSYLSLIAEGGSCTAIMTSDGMAISGTKPRVIDTPDFGAVKTYAYETAGCFFGDIGEGKISADGKCYIDMDLVLLETINTDCGYQVFLQPYQGTISRIERYRDYFVVYGDVGMTFAWEIKAKQRDFTSTRLEPEPGFIRAWQENLPDPVDVDYDARAEAYLQDYERLTIISQVKMRKKTGK